MEEGEGEQDTSIKGRLLALVYKIKGPPQKTEEEPAETEQAAPSKFVCCFFLNKREKNVLIPRSLLRGW